MPIRANAQNLHVDATRLFNCPVVDRSGSRNAFAVAQRRPVKHVTRHVHQIRVQSKRFHNSAVNGGMVRLRVIKRQSQVFVQCETAHLRYVNMLAVYNACERLVCGERTGSGCQTQYRIRLGFDEIGD